MASRISPFGVLFLLLLCVPLIEIYLLINVGRIIGAGTTVLLVVLTAIIGAWLLRWQGLATLSRFQAASQRGELPAIELVEGLILLVCGALLLTPGFFTDAIGFVALIPGARRWFAANLLRGFLSRANHVHVHTTESRVIEGSFRREDGP